VSPQAFSAANEVGLATKSDPPFGVKLLICFLFADAASGGIELLRLEPDIAPHPTIAIFILWLVIEILLAILLAWKARAGLYLTQAILIVHVFYLGHELSTRPHIWIAMSLLRRARIVASIFLDGCFAAYLASATARAHLNDEP